MPATVARAVTGSRQSSLEQSALRVESHLFSFPLASTSPSGKWGLGEGTRPWVLYYQGFTELVLETQELRLLVPPCHPEGGSVEPAGPHGSYSPVILSPQMLVCGIGWALIDRVTSSDSFHLEGFSGRCVPFVQVAVSTAQLVYTGLLSWLRWGSDPEPCACSTTVP